MENLSKFVLNAEAKSFISNVDYSVQKILEEFKGETLVTSREASMPLLAYFGYTLYDTNLTEQIYHTATSAQLLYVVSKIIQQIPGDTTKAVTLSTQLLRKAAELISEINDPQIRLFNEMVNNMPQDVTPESLRELLDCPAAKWVQNSLVIGMESHDALLHNPKLEIVGDKLSYVFQILDSVNCNFETTSRQDNIQYSYLKEFMSKKEKLALDSGGSATFNELLKKYNIREIIKKELYFIEIDIRQHMSRLGDTLSTYDFLLFITSVFDLARSEVA